MSDSTQCDFFYGGVCISRQKEQPQGEWMLAEDAIMPIESLEPKVRDLKRKEKP